MGAVLLMVVSASRRLGHSDSLGEVIILDSFSLD